MIYFIVILLLLASELLYLRLASRRDSLRKWAKGWS